MRNQYSSLNNFRNKINDIARPYNFTATFTGGCFSKLGKDADTLIASLRTAALPSLTVTPVTINYFGMEYKIAGAPVFDQLACQIIIDDKYETRDMWRKALENVFTYEEATGPKWTRPGPTNSGYMGTVTLIPLDTDGAEAGKYVLSMAWVSILGAISWDQGTKDTPLTFDATIVYSFYTKK